MGYKGMSLRYRDRDAALASGSTRSIGQRGSHLGMSNWGHWTARTALPVILSFGLPNCSATSDRVASTNCPSVDAEGADFVRVTKQGDPLVPVWHSIWGKVLDIQSIEMMPPLPNSTVVLYSPFTVTLEWGERAHESPSSAVDWLRTAVGASTETAQSFILETSRHELIYDDMIETRHVARPVVQSEHTAPFLDSPHAQALAAGWVGLSGVGVGNEGKQCLVYSVMQETGADYQLGYLMLFELGESGWEFRRSCSAGLPSHVIR